MQAGGTHPLSGAKYWLNCAGWPRLVARNKDVFDPPSNNPPHANRIKGLAFHKLFDLSIRRRVRPPASLIGRRWQGMDRKKPVGHTLSEVDVSQLQDLYDKTLGWLAEAGPGAQLFTELPVPVASSVYPIEGWEAWVAYIDILVISPTYIRVADAKLGSTPVPLEHRPPRFAVDEQVFSYLAAVVEHPTRDSLGLRFNSTGKLHLTIYQPNSMDVPTWQHRSLDWGEYVELRDRARTAFDATLRQARLTAGQWCKYCPAQGVCKSFNEAVHLAFTPRGEPLEEVLTKNPQQFYSLDEIQGILDMAPLLSAQAAKAMEVAVSAAQQGRRWRGYRLERQRKHKTWADEAKVWEWIAANDLPLADAAEHNLRSPYKLTAFARACGVGDVELHHLSELVSHPQGSLVLKSEIAPPSSAAGPTPQQMFAPIKESAK